MRGFLALLFALCAACGSSPPASRAPLPGSGAEAILAAVLSEVTVSTVSEDITHCIAPEPYGLPRILGYLHKRSFGSSMKWLDRTSGKVRELSGAEAEEVNGAARTLIGWNAPVLSGAIPPEAIQRPWRVKREGEECGYNTSLSSPLLTGGWAFVEVSSDCGGLCGDGWLYALRLDGSSWHVVASSPLWIA